MAALGAGDWSVTVLTDRIHQKIRHVRATITLPTTGTYTTNGVPIPLFSKFGFKRNVEDIQIDGMDAGSGLLYKYDGVNGTIRVYTTSNGTELATTVSTGSPAVLYITARGW